MNTAAFAVTPHLSAIPVDDLPSFIQRIRASRLWWHQAALEAYGRGNYRAITGRNDDAIYLLRFWLTPPQLGPDQGLESGDSILLHFFARGDDDQALHDHPWDFTTTILTGGYWEHLPPADWQPDNPLGPAWNARTESRSPGQSVFRVAEQLHCVGQVFPGTVTLVRTGKRRRDWGFHPCGETWTPWRTYLQLA